MGTRRVVTETHAWCAKGQHMVERAGFAKGQNTCRECRRIHYNRRGNYSHGKTCKECGTPVANTNVGGHCADCFARLHVARKAAPRRYRDFNGYVVLTAQWDHPNASQRGHLKEHTKVMSEVLNRALLPNENVHHINGVKDDNRSENLELWTRSQPSGQRVADKVQWAKDLLAIYEPDALATPQLRFVEELSA